MKLLLRYSLMIAILPIGFALNSCQSPTGMQESITSIEEEETAVTRFVSTGAKAVKIITSDAAGGSFSVPTLVPVSTPVPPLFPGYDGSAVYTPGVSAVTYYDVDGTTSISKPSWLHDVQLGITGITSTSTCAAFGGSGTLDVSGFYRVSESDCGAVSNGTGSNVDPVFIRIVLNRDTTVLGSAENLMVQVEYQASSIRLNSDGVSSNPEDNLDQLWKMFWNTSLSSSASPSVFSIFVPPNYSSCQSGGTSTAGAPGNCTGTYTGAPITVRQMIFPLSAYPTMSVIQISRVKGRINNVSFFDSPANTIPVNYVSSFCPADQPLCLGLVVRSLTLMRM